MIRTLRKKFILINMLLIFIVLFVIFSYMVISSYKTAVNESINTLEMALGKRMGNMPGSPIFQIGGNSPGEFMRHPVFVVSENIGTNTFTLYASNVTVEETDILEIVSIAFAGEESEGYLKDYNLRYMKTSDRGLLQIAFVDTTAEKVALRSTLTSSLLSLLGALLAFFLISFFLSGWALKPVKKAWEQQQKFVSDASHELKTPLTVILANMGILKASPNDSIAEQQQWVDNTQAEAERMKSLVEDMLYLAKSEDTAVPENSLPLNFSDIVSAAALTFESLAYENEISIDSSSIAENVYIKGDEGRIRQLLSVLMDNSIKYSHPGGEVTVALDASGGQTVLKIANCGETVSKEALPHLFDRFYREDTSRSTGGYGLGLSIAKSIVENCGGKIKAESENGVTTFTVFFDTVAP